MLSFKTISPLNDFSIYAESNFLKKITEKEKLKVILPRPVYSPPLIFRYTVFLKSSGIVEGAKMFQPIFTLYANFNNKLKVFYRCRKIRQQNFSLPGEYERNKR
jgi:hypothetical protein